MANIDIRFYIGLRNLFMSLPESLIRKWERFNERKLKKQHYTEDVGFSGSQKVVISVINDYVNAGGLTDRINGILTTYYVCRKLNLPYKIAHTYPFNLENYLIPAKVDWRISERDICQTDDTEVIFIRSLVPPRPAKRIKSLEKAILHSPERQLHVYTNIKAYPDNQFSELYNDLFAPSVQLHNEIDKCLVNIGREYRSMTFRFQQLLGDFKEGDFPVLNEFGKKSLINRCLNVIEYIRKTECCDILVTSDSSTFLQYASEMSGVRVVSGKLVHMAYNEDSSFDTHLKSFLDLYLIANAKTVYSVVLSPMYDSGFPLMASRIYNKPFIKITQDLELC